MRSNSKDHSLAYKFPNRNHSSRALRPKIKRFQLKKVVQKRLFAALDDNQLD